MLKATHQINEGDVVEVSKQKYNELGQLSRKKLHGSLQQIDYEYNIRGWLTGINNPNSLGNDLFAMQLDYETGTNPQFNGNISSVSWKSEYYDDLKQYQFEYDALNRLIEADYADNAAYSTSYAYDKNGNINNLSRNGKVDNIVGAIDSLYYSYNGNQLTRVTDFATGDYNQFGFNENGANNTIDYDYDANGNMKWDKNKGITNISYNQLNLPTQINIERDENKQIKYIYTATGSKLRKQTLGNAAENITTDYVGAFVYETTDDLELQFIQTSEGRIVPDENGGFDYEYALKDHLGNTRVMFSQTGDILQDQSYYPFGMSLGDELTYQNTDDSPKNKYLYNGKELQPDFELGWYDYGARFYDPALGRWHIVDPLAEDYFDLSPYNYSFNNPFRYIDPDGRGPFDKVLDKAAKYAANVAYNSMVAVGRSIVRSAKSAMGDTKLVAKSDATVSLGFQVAEKVVVDNKSVASIDVNPLSVDLFSIEASKEFSSDGLSSSTEIDYIGKDGEVEGNTSIGGSILAVSGGVESEYQLKDGELNAQSSASGGVGSGTVKHTKDMNSGESTTSVGYSAGSKFAVGIGLEVNLSIMLEKKNDEN